MANMEELAPEILLSILGAVTHLHDLHHLLTASPACFRTFNTYASVAVEAVLSGQRSLLPLHMQQLVRILILVRAGTLPLPDLASVEARCIGVSLLSSDTVDRRFAPGPGSISADTPASIIRSVVATSARIHTLTQNCLHFYLARLHAITPRHADASDLVYQWNPGNDWAREHQGVFSIQPWDREFPSTPYQPVDAGPPGWVERMRVERTLWRMCIFLDLQTAGKRGLLALWSAEDVQRLQETRLLAASALMGVREWYGEFEELRSVAEYVSEISGGEDWEQRGCLPLPLRTGDAAVDWSEPVPDYDMHRDWWERVPGQAEYMGIFLEWPVPPYWSRRLRTYWRSRRYTPAYRLEQSHCCIRDGSAGWHFYTHFSEDRERPLWQCTFDPYRRLGMSFWDRGRLTTMGLLHPIQGQRSMDGFDCYTWRSLLTADELDEVKARIRDSGEQATALDVLGSTLAYTRRRRH